MQSIAIPRSRDIPPLFGWQRVVVALLVSAFFGFLASQGFINVSKYVVVMRAMVEGLVALVAFGVFERWPARLPGWLPRWVAQVFAVGFVMPWTVFLIYVVSAPAGEPPFWDDKLRLNGFFTLTMTGLFVGPWTAVAAIFRQRGIALQTQAEAFRLEVSELERKALDARLRLLQAQVEPHFLFNTLANVRELVVSGSPQAAKVLDSLIAYLRAAVPRLHEAATTMANEIQLVRAYLELMHLRMPDRLQFELQVDPAALDLRCPPTTLLTLVENAIRHGIDPSEEGGRIEVRVDVKGERCLAQVRDTGAGLRAGGNGLGTGLESLRERLQLVFGGDAQLRIVSNEPRGTLAEIDFPVNRARP